jgi:hypothetical protein
MGLKIMALKYSSMVRPTEFHKNLLTGTKLGRRDKNKNVI